MKKEKKELEGKVYCGCDKCSCWIEDGVHQYHCDADLRDQMATAPQTDYVHPCGSRY